jgi:hypothetical protein
MVAIYYYAADVGILFGNCNDELDARVFATVAHKILATFEGTVGF